MRSGIHPEYHKVLYVDNATGEEWTSFATLTSSENREFEGQKIPVIKLEISASSHPFWTGKARELDSEGRIDRFRRRYASKKK